MKENERLSNKLNSWFWFILTTLPIIIIIIYYIFAMPQYAKNSSQTYLGFIAQTHSINVLTNLLSPFNTLAIGYIKTTFINMFQNVFSINYENSILLGALFGYMLSIQIYHLIYDVLKFIIGWCHHLIEKAYF